MSGAPKLFIATPTTDGIVLAGYGAALAQLFLRLGARDIGWTYETLDGADLTLQRDVLADRFLASGCTHLLFIDSDMIFPPELAETLLAFNVPLVGAAYPRRNLDLDALKALAADRSFEDALALAYAWNFRPLGRSITVRGGLALVEGLGGGFLLIRRDCLEGLAERADLPLYEARGRARPLRSFFQEARVGEGIVDADYSFCRRWIACGGEVLAYLDAEVRHLGDFRPAPPFLAHLQARAAAQAP